MFNPAEHQHRRYNPLKGEWVLVCPQRLKRPWEGQQESTAEDNIPEYDVNNPLCPGNVRSNGEINPIYESTFTFPNDFPALNEEWTDMPKGFDPLFQVAPAQGCCRVMCFHPKTNITLPLMSESEVLEVVSSWMTQTLELGEKYEWVQIFENKGAMMGCSNPHPHCQIWASRFIPTEAEKKSQNQLEYFKKYNRPLLMDYLQKELQHEERIVATNNDWVVLVPFWAVWPFETMILPRQHVRRIYELNLTQRRSLANIIRVITAKYDNIFKISFPYSMGWHGAPTGKYSKETMDHWVFHGIYFPPLLRSASIRKFMVGYEMLAESQRDMTPEKAAAILRQASDKHYKESEMLRRIAAKC